MIYFILNGAASISTTLLGRGKAVLEFGNCGKGGTVTAYKNYFKVSSDIGAEKFEKVVFDFEDSDVLRITLNGPAVIHFSDLKFISCPSSESGSKNFSKFYEKVPRFHIFLGYFCI